LRFIVYKTEKYDNMSYMEVINRKKTWISGLLLALISVLPLWGDDNRTTPLDVYIIVDSSSAMEKGKAEAVAWLCDTVVEGILKEGDRVSIWTAGVKPELIYSDTVASGAKETIKERIRGIQFSGDAADYPGALRQAQARIQSQSKGRLTYTLVVSGSSAADPRSRDAESAGLLLYSRVDTFSGWRVLTVGLDIAGKVRSSAAAFMKNK
jgi:hypothetical protein